MDTFSLTEPKQRDERRAAPVVRAAHCRTNLEHLGRLPAAEREAVLARVRTTTTEAIGSASRLGYVPLLHDVDLIAAIDAALGRAALRAFSRRVFETSLESPFLQPFVKGAIRLFGIEPGVVLKVVPRGWTQLYRDCGRLEIGARGSRHLELRIQAAPDVLVRSAPYLASIAAALEALFPLCQVQGRCGDPTPGRAPVLRLEWR